jgi:predicted molibdopterin-dependent oxidoreductase YjgC
MGEDLLTFQHERERMRQALLNLDVLIVQDLFKTEFTSLATILFPVASHFERQGTFTNLEGRVQRFECVSAPPQNVKADWEILSAVSAAMGTSIGFTDVFQITEEIASVIETYSITKNFLSPERKNAISWLSEEEWKTGKPWLREEWQGRIASVTTHGGSSNEENTDYPILLIPGRISSFWETGNRSSRILFLGREENRATLQLNPNDAEMCGVKNGWKVRIKSCLKDLETLVSINEDLPRGYAYLPMHKNGGNIPRIPRKLLPIRIEPC